MPQPNSPVDRAWIEKMDQTTERFPRRYIYASLIYLFILGIKTIGENQHATPDVRNALLIGWIDSAIWCGVGAVLAYGGTIAIRALLAIAWEARKPAPTPDP